MKTYKFPQNFEAEGFLNTKRFYYLIAGGILVYNIMNLPWHFFLKIIFSSVAGSGVCFGTFARPKGYEAGQFAVNMLIYSFERLRLSGQKTAPKNPPSLKEAEPLSGELSFPKFPGGIKIVFGDKP